MIDFATRKRLPHLLNGLGLLGWGVEVGVRGGGFSQWIRQRWDGQLLIAVDPWRPTADYFDSSAVSEDQHTSHYQKARQHLRPFGCNAQIVRMTSVEAASHFERHSLDWVYIDANHGAASVHGDLLAWWLLVKPGGIVAGHDYYNAKRRKDGTPLIVDHVWEADLDTYGVKVAVDTFAETYDLKIVTTTEDTFPSWLIHK